VAATLKSKVHGIRRSVDIEHISLFFDCVAPPGGFDLDLTAERNGMNGFAGDRI
jgi:hypothetical protein